MKLHVVFEMDLEEKDLRREFHTEDEQQTAIVFRSLLWNGIEDSINQVDAQNVKLDVTLKE